MDEPSKVMPSSRAFSSSAGLMAKLFELAEHVGEPEADEADAALLHRAQHVVLVPLHAHPVQSCRAGVLSGNRSARRVPWRDDPPPPFTRSLKPAPSRLVSVISRVTTYGSMLAFGRRSSV